MKMPQPAPTETEDWYTLPDGRLVFKEAYHRKRGTCCGSGCRHCPYNYEAVREPRRSLLRAERATQNNRDAG